MTKPVVLAVLLAIGSSLAGCVVEPLHDHPGYRGDRDYRYQRDRDGDGVPNRYDSRPANPYRR
jgi:hypothetical protein